MDELSKKRLEKKVGTGEIGWQRAKALEYFEKENELLITPQELGKIIIDYNKHQKENE